MNLDLAYLSNVLLKHTQLQALVEAEFTMLPRPFDLMVTLQKQKTNISPPVCLSVCCSNNGGETYLSQPHLHDLVQNSHDAVCGSSEVRFGR